ncbi:carbamoyltransferase HypF [Glycomyces harbinensis]|uniref:Carbamoyltransferase n=1 Tax=Glycomyces harbinensis TaxID=58114 RepID=A0A1G6XQ21_9ACTN|nr:carbamoyltransferase HypF [Glycomyces harbinensis]SDD79406.1 hydrogenase maturation protein HypF [Glycomyces harbinensis]
MRTAERTAQRIELHGIVQGVGFRPYVYRLARDCGIAGQVYNAGGDVVIEALGSNEDLESFMNRLPRETPPGAVITTMVSTPFDAQVGKRFSIGPSVAARTAAHGLTPDLATCDDCLLELFDPGDRRYRYPFLNCSSCGPRASVVEALPYDRERTTMRRFTLCPDCRGEYENPADRRFHAEPIACPACGPRLSWSGGSEEGAALAAAVRTVAAGGLIAVKGVGGYQLVCDAADEDAIARVRAVKSRPVKALAVMVPDVGGAMAAARLSDAELRLMREAARPIVLAESRGSLPRQLAPGSDRIGLFLPYSPLHHLLLTDLDRPLVVSSANLRGEPMIVDDEIAFKLGPSVDGILAHDRPIAARYDDSVAQVVDGRPRLLRRARGYAPAPIPIPDMVAKPLLAVGAQRKHTCALAVADQAVLGPHNGDLASAQAFASFTGTVDRLSRLCGADPVAVAHDLHPGYLSTQYAEGLKGLDRVGVQHHHAHVVACAAEHGVPAPFVGVAYDGLGYGSDGELWGGEVMVADYTGFERTGRFAMAPMPGGERAAERPARMAMGYLFGPEPGLGKVDLGYARGFLNQMDGQEVALIRRMIERGVHSPRISSAGRLFDAAASLLGLCDDNTFEGEAAMRLEAAARDHGGRALPWQITRRDGLWVLDPAVTLQALLVEARTRPIGQVAARFHAAIVEATATLVMITADRAGTDRVCLGGGVFANRILAEGLMDLLRGQGFEVYLGERVPPGDGGIAYGQVAILAARLARQGAS